MRSRVCPEPSGGNSSARRFGPCCSGKKRSRNKKGGGHDARDSRLGRIARLRTPAARLAVHPLGRGRWVADVGDFQTPHPTGAEDARARGGDLGRRGDAGDSDERVLVLLVVLVLRWWRSFTSSPASSSRAGCCSQ